jgi:hypothetical protein
MTASLASAPKGPADGSFTLRMLLLKFILPTVFHTPQQKLLLEDKLTDVLLASQR